MGHAIELDRILGWEAAYAGTSWLDLAKLGNLSYGSELMNIVLDPGVPAQVADALRHHRAPASSLVLEITESVAVSDLAIVDDVPAVRSSASLRS